MRHTASLCRGFLLGRFGGFGTEEVEGPAVRLSPYVAHGNIKGSTLFSLVEGAIVHEGDDEARW